MFWKLIHSSMTFHQDLLRAEGECTKGQDGAKVLKVRMYYECTKGQDGAKLMHIV